MTHLGLTDHDYLHNLPMSGGMLVTGGLVGLAATGVASAVAAGVIRRERTYQPRGHASRVDTRRDPLGVALRYGCAGLAVGIRVDTRGRLRVAGDHDPGRTLRALVLDPLSARVAPAGRVYGAQHQPFSVVLEPDPDADPPALLHALDRELAPYAPILITRTGDTVRPGPVSVVIAGPPGRLLTREPARAGRLCFGEGTLADLDRGIPSLALPIVGEHVAWRLGWDGRDAMPPEERHLLRALVRTARAEGKRVRVYGIPEQRRTVRLAFWRELHAAGVDLIGARDVGALRRFLRRQHAHRWAAPGTTAARQVNS